MLVENIVLTRQSVNVAWTYACHMDLRGYKDVTCSNPYYNSTN